MSRGVLPLYDPATFAGNRVAPLTGPALLMNQEWNLRPTNLEFQQTLSLRTIHHRNGISLHEGDIVILQAGADDFDDVTFNKQPGLSHQIELHIVMRNALEIDLNREQAKVQQDLMRLREKEREALKLVTDVENKLKKHEKLTEDDQAKLLQAEQDQQQIHERIGDEKEGLRAEVEARVANTAAEQAGQFRRQRSHAGRATRAEPARGQGTRSHRATACPGTDSGGVERRQIVRRQQGGAGKESLGIDRQGESRRE